LSLETFYKQVSVKDGVEALLMCLCKLWSTIQVDEVFIAKWLLRETS